MNRCYMLTYKLFLLCCCSILVAAKTYAQCDPPTSVTQTITDATCVSNGMININTVSGGTGTPQFSLYNATNTTLIKPWQASASLTDLAPGTYTLRVRYQCAAPAIGTSNEYVKTITVGGNYIAPSINGVTVLRHDQGCNNGRIQVNIAGGAAPVTYALINSFGETEPIGSYVRPPQASNVFDGLDAGTYYVRVYDGCNSYVTSSVVVNNQTGKVGFSNDVTYYPCDSLVFRIFNTTDLGAADAAKKIWIKYTNGTIDTLASGVGNSFDTSLYIPISKLLYAGEPSTPSNPFPDNMGSAWNKVLWVYYMNSCGLKDSAIYGLPDPVDLAFAVKKAPFGQTCDSTMHVFEITDGLASSPINYYFSPNASYNINGGPWIPFVTGPDSVNGFKFPNDNSVNTVCIRYECDGVQQCFNVQDPPTTPAALNPLMVENNFFSCQGSSGLYLKDLGAGQYQNFPCRFALLNAAGDTVTQTIFTSLASSNDYFIYNLPLGNYTYVAWDDCGSMGSGAISLTVPYTNYDFDFYYACGQANNLTIDFKDNIALHNTDFYTNHTEQSGKFKAQILKASDYSLALPGTFTSKGYSSVDYMSSDIENIDVSSLPVGDYIVRVWKPVGTLSSSMACPYIDKPWTKSNSIITLSNSALIESCPGTPTTSTLIVVAEGGKPDLQYTLYENTYPSTPVAGPQASNIFNGLTSSGTYIVNVSDQCGRGVQSSFSAGSVPLAVYNNAGGSMPCPGSSLTLSVREMEGVTYQWYKDGAALPGETATSLTIAGIDNSDAGEYEVQVSVGTCVTLISVFTLNPNECGTVLPVVLKAFSVKALQNSALLSWATATELNNKGFAIERSADGRNWSAIGFVNSQASGGNTTLVQEYQFVDDSPLPGRSYYRLKQVDNDGRFIYSGVEKLNFTQRANIRVLPNPTKNHITITGIKGTELIRVTNATGQQVVSEKATGLQHQVNLQSFPSGVYFVTIISAKEQPATYKVIKE